MVAILYGLVSITGGALGAHLIAIPGLPPGADNPSMVSFYAGGGAGLVLVICGIGLWRGSRIAAWATLIVPLVLLGGRFVPSLIKNSDDLAGFFDKTAGKVTIAMVVGGLLTILVSGLALFRSKPTTQSQTQG
jgi:hypothetical protein